MCTGKNSVGTQLAEKLNKEFVDTDNLIEKTQKMLIPNIFENKKINFLLNQRKSLYEMSADQSIDTTNCNLEEIVEKIIQNNK